ncbi:MAG TPA: hypothetical protein VF344_03170 [Candidatus Limnocylindrales bacterium]
MDRLLAIGSDLPQWQVPMLAIRGAELAPFGALVSGPEPNSVATFDGTKPRDPATEQQLTMHFISHVNASCFVSLLQILDPLPDDYQARAEYRRFYRQLHESLEIPPPPRDA